MFGVAVETARGWAAEFERHLSPRANPGTNKTRAFTQTDLEILALVAEYKEQRLTFNDIHTALDNGQRGTPPAYIPVENPQDSENQEKQLTIQNTKLTQALEAAREQLTLLAEENIRLQTSLKHETVEREKLERRITELTQHIEELSIKAGEQYAKGFGQGIRFERGERDE
jgi:DNA-binding transcriptional MerR regulator